MGRHRRRLGPMKEAAWGARPRTVKMAALLGVRLNDRRPAPICMGGCAAQGVGLGGPTDTYLHPLFRQPLSSQSIQTDTVNSKGDYGYLEPVLH